MLLVLATAAAIFGLPILGILLALVQRLFYRLRGTQPDDVPPFIILVFRGVLLGMVLLAIAAVTAHLVTRDFPPPTDQRAR